MSYSRFNRLIDSHALPAEMRQKVFDRLFEANVAQDDPLAVVFVVEANIEQRAQALASLPDRMAGRLRADLADSNSALVDGLRQTVEKTLRQTSAQAIRGARRNSVMNLVAACILGGTAIGGLGVAVGAQIGQDRSASFLETLAASHEAEGWEQLMRRNRGLVDFISTHCGPESVLFIPEARGGPACNVPLWIRDARTPAPASFPARLSAEISHLLDTIPARLALLIGMLITLAAHPLIRWMIRRNSQGAD
jgi:hypothetical protein